MQSSCLPLDHPSPAGNGPIGDLPTDAVEPLLDLSLDLLDPLDIRLWGGSRRTGRRDCGVNNSVSSAHHSTSTASRGRVMLEHNRARRTNLSVTRHGSLTSRRMDMACSNIRRIISQKPRLLRRAW